MGKLEFLQALRRAMDGLPPALQASTLTFYEQRFVDAASAGVAEQTVAQELGDPTRIAMTVRASTRLSTFETADASQAMPHKASKASKAQRSAADTLRLFMSAIGLVIFNVFMVVPAGVFCSLVAALFTAGLGFYVGGIAITASGMAGATELVLDGPFAHVAVSSDSSVRAIERTRTRITISETGVNIDQEPIPPSVPGGKAGAGAGAGAGGILIESDVDPDSRTVQTLFGFSLVLGGIALLLLGLIVTRYSFFGIKRYVQMNIALLKGS